MNNELKQFKFAIRQLTQEETKQLASLLITLNTRPEVECQLKDDPDMMKMFPAKIAEKRIGVMGLVNLSNFFFALSILTFVKNAGTTVILLWIANNYAKKYQKTYLNAQDWCHVFPLGVPTEASLDDFWEKQKIGSGNWIDSEEAWI